MADGEGLNGHTSPCWPGKVCIAAMADGAGPSQTQQIGKLPLSRAAPGSAGRRSCHFIWRRRRAADLL